MSSQSSITFDSTLAFVLSHDFRVSSTTLGKVVAQNFAQNPNLPGVIVMDETRFLGMISRAKFREQMNTLQRENLYLNSPIQVLLDYLRTPPLLLDHNSKIADAVNSVLNRSKELIYEPVVIVCENNIFRIIDIQVLLLAQNQLLNYAQNVIQQQQSRIQQSSEIIKIEKNKVQKCSKYYQSKQELLKKNYKDFLKVKQQEIFETAQKITEINENFLQISQLVIKETDKSFNEIVVNTNSINSNTNHIQEISTSIADDLDSMHSASNLINKIIQQIRHLAIKGSIVAYQSQSTPQGFNQINKEINQMLNQILNINQQMNKMANHFKFHVHKLQDIAQNQSGISRSVSLKLERVEMVMKELKHLIDNYNPNLIILIVEQAKDISPELIQFLDHTPEKQINSDSNGKGLIELIERTLKHRNDSPPSES
ncbi:MULTISPECIES: hypothetical protein [Planktothrix]|uniref:Chemotaxis protein n=1 Tax=Planktothrix rubescens CCAP 1459/22 TaxID=329571 RepID=A0A6J7ZI08_PLARU|nr:MULTISPECIES: hypothetical protein [Planktothrix]CAC5341109.1 conserved hypothetical protein [Planktothrix rubescens NIVA-CYA 18]CAD5934160.1 hypothetical protein PCC7821_01481 [Planktothrix rubescens NIVA-CYA 18]